MLDKLAQHFQENYYPDAPVELVREQLDRPEVINDAMAHIAKNGHDDGQLNDASILHGIDKIVTENPDIKPDELAAQLAKTHGKPLVNWFSRQKEFEFSNPTDEKGNVIVDKKTGKPLQKTIKRVIAPDSVLSPGFTKTVTHEQKNETTTTPAKKFNIGLPFPAFSIPAATMFMGGLAGSMLAHSLYPNITDNTGGKNTNHDMIANALTVLLGTAGGAAGVAAGLPAYKYLTNNYHATFGGSPGQNAESWRSSIPSGSHFGESLRRGAELITGMPVNLFGRDIVIPKSTNTKVVNERTVEKEHNVQPGEAKLSPRFL